MSQNTHIRDKELNAPVVDPAPRSYDSPPTPLRPGTQLGPYEIVALIGRGGMGEVYRATDTRIHRTSR